ncbi:MAG: alpha/beta hydrolase [Actinomycetota bacterium]|nr:alpha/beta hydrolase [Actinomycetota bacterium]
MSTSAPTRRALRFVAVGVGVATGAAVGGGLAAAAHFARTVLTPDARRPDDVQVLAVGADTVTLEATADTVVPGRYGLWLDGGAGHARVDEVVDQDARAVVRRLVATDRGRLRPGGARWNQYWHWDSPRVSLGIAHRDVAVPGEDGPLPAWLVEPERANGRWAVLVHGRGALREECLRAVPTLRRLGYTCLVIAYRNDIGAPPAPDGRYNLGLSEWRDLEAAMLYAVDHGARGLVLGGWSMGGAIILQTLHRSPVSDVVEAVVLDSPVVDWGDVLAHHARLHHLPRVLEVAGTTMMGRRSTRRLVGVHDPVDVAATNWVARADELTHPMLVQVSVDDEFVPAGPALALAAVRPDVVTLERWDTARHCKEWNLDPGRWERSVAEFLTSS